MVFAGRLAEEEIDKLAHEQEQGLHGAWLYKAQHCQEQGLHGVWLYKAQHCPMNNQQGHEYIPINWQLTPKTKHVSTLMCTRCFHELNISEAFEKRSKL